MRYNAPSRHEEPRKRIPIEFSKEAYDRLLVIQQSTDATSHAEVIRNALRLYNYLLQNKKQGWSLQLVKDKFIKEIDLLF